MTFENSNNSYMLNFLCQTTPGSNPFLLYKNINEPTYRYPNSNSVIYKNYKLVRCPICLGEVLSPVHPNPCKHIFCRYCIGIWKKQTNICPICKR